MNIEVKAREALVEKGVEAPSNDEVEMEVYGIAYKELNSRSAAKASKSTHFTSSSLLLTLLNLNLCSRFIQTRSQSRCSFESQQEEEEVVKIRCVQLFYLAKSNLILHQISITTVYMRERENGI